MSTFIIRKINKFWKGGLSITFLVTVIVAALLLGTPKQVSAHHDTSWQNHDCGTYSVGFNYIGGGDTKTVFAFKDGIQVYHNTFVAVSSQDDFYTDSGNLPANHTYEAYMFNGTVANFPTGGTGNVDDDVEVINYAYSCTKTPTNTPTFTPTNTPDPTATPTDTFTPSNTPSNTPTATRTHRPTRTPTFTPTNTGTRQNTYTPTFTPTFTKTLENTPTATLTATHVDPTLTSTPTATKGWVPSTDSCDVYDWALSVPVALAYGILDSGSYWVAGYVPFDSGTPNKRGLVFDPGTMQTGMKVFVQSTDGTYFVYDVTVISGQAPRCDAEQKATPTLSAPTATNCIEGVNDAVVTTRHVGQSVVFAEAKCDPDYWAKDKNGNTIKHIDHFIGNIAYPADCKIDVYVYINGKLDQVIPASC